MIRRSLAALLALVAALAAALVVAPAGAQIQLGASVPSFIALSIGAPTGFARVRGGGPSYEIRVPVAVTATDNGARLTIADGEDLKAPARGHLRDGSRVVGAPLEVAVAGGAAQPLSAPADPLLETWSRPVSNAAVTIALRQSLASGANAVARLHKTVLITLSSQTP